MKKEPFPYRPLTTILAGGYGSRLNERHDALPNALVEVAIHPTMNTYVC